MPEYMKGTIDAKGDVPRNFRIDRPSDTLQSIDFAHHMIHSGRTWRITDFREVPAATPKNLLFRAPPLSAETFIHMLWTNIITEAEFEINVFRDPTVTLDGTPFGPIVNADDNTLDAPQLQVFEDPTISADGDRISGVALGVGGGTPGAARDQSEFILRVDTDYLYRIEKRTSGTDFVTLQIIWYESRTDKN